MKFSQWIEQFFRLKKSGTNQSSNSFDRIIVTKVIRIEKHPNADRLRVIALSDGIKEHYPVVCGAFNFSEGDLVALALPGASIAQNIHSDSHEPFILDKAKIRGVESQGMICAAYELGLSNDPGQGIMLLKESSKLGSNFSPDLIKS